MWIKQVTPLVGVKGCRIIPEGASELLAESKFVPPASLDWYMQGFVPPLSIGDAPYIFDSHGSMRFALRRDDRLLPMSIVRAKVGEAVKKIEIEEGRKVGRRERMVLRENVIDTLLPKTLCRTSITEALYDDETEMMFIGTSSTNKADSMVSALRIAWGGLAMRLIRTKVSPKTVMTNWLQQQECEGGFELGDSCVLAAVGPRPSTVRIKNTVLECQEVMTHLENGKHVLELNLVWNGQVVFTLDENMCMKSIEWLSHVTEETANAGDDLVSIYSATQIIMTQTLAMIYNELIELMGGLIKEENENE